MLRSLAVTYTRLTSCRAKRDISRSAFGKGQVGISQQPPPRPCRRPPRSLRSLAVTFTWLRSIRPKGEVSHPALPETATLDQNGIFPANLGFFYPELKLEINYSCYDVAGKLSSISLRRLSSNRRRRPHAPFLCPIRLMRAIDVSLSKAIKSCS